MSVIVTEWWSVGMFVVWRPLYVRFGSKVGPRPFGCVAMGSAVLVIFRSRVLLYSTGSGVNRVKVVLSGECFVLSRQKLYVALVVCISWLVLDGRHRHSTTRSLRFLSSSDTGTQ